MSNYRRARIPGGSFFFTVALAEQRSSLLVDRIDDLRAAFRVARAKRPFRIDAIVVLPEHLHCIWTLPPDDPNFALRWASVKAGFSRRIERGERRRASRIKKRERGLWQRRYWEHALRDAHDFAAHVDYIHFNPVKHGLVRRVIDWPYSSFHRYVSVGQLEAEWGARW